jgi:small conductance mechanosensitive channel
VTSPLTYRVGDYIEIVSVEGRGDALSVFSTVLMHPDRSRIIVPNRKVAREILLTSAASVRAR